MRMQVARRETVSTSLRASKATFSSAEALSAMSATADQPGNAPSIPGDEVNLQSAQRVAVGVDGPALCCGPIA